MTLVIGTDEAGYGPNLGPLVIAATAWRTTAAPDAAEGSLAAAVAAAAPGLWGDSKKIYRAGAGLGALERGVLVALAMASRDRTVPADWQALVERLVAHGHSDPPPEAGSLSQLAIPCCPAGRGTSLPQQQAAVATMLESAGIRLEAIRCRILQPAEFNALLATGLNKSDILSQVTLDLAADLATLAEGDEPCVIWCDRHGGRRRYAPLVARAFDLSLVRPLEETARFSAYALPPSGRIEFAVGGEARMPVAVASMTAKYVRELAMLAFNAHWSDRVPGLIPTAGYPVDAVRWRHDAAAAVAAAGIGQDALWRRA